MCSLVEKRFFFFVEICRTLKSTRTFPGAKQGGMKGEVKRGEVVRECTGPEGERGGRNEGKRVGSERGPKAYSKNSDFSTPLI